MSRRTIELQGCLNFRDLGGYPTATGEAVRWGWLYRSDALHLLTAEDVAIMRDVLRVGTVIDLRSTSELENDGQGLLKQQAIDFHHIPLFDGGQTRNERPPIDTLADIYFMLSDFARDPIARVIRVLAESPAPAVYHCAAGKDRTGVISAVLLSLLGVEDELIVADYALSAANIDAIIDRLNATKGYRDMLETLPPETMHALPQTMEGFLAKISQRYGSMEGYATEIGLDEATIARLRASLLE